MLAAARAGRAEDESAERTGKGAAILCGIGAGVYADVPSALEDLRYTESPVEPAPEEVSFYDAAFRRVYGRIYPTLRGVHHEIQALQSQQFS